MSLSRVDHLSIVALSSGVSGALFFSPFFILVVGFPPTQAIGAGLMTEVFGMGNGLLNYVRQRTVDYVTAKWLLLGAVPAVVVGAFSAHFVPTTLLTLAFGAGLLVLGGFLLYYDSPEECVPGECGGEFLKEKNSGRRETVIETRDGETYRYDTCWRPPGVGMATVGGFITGLISAGLPEITTTQLIVRQFTPSRRRPSGTSWRGRCRAFSSAGRSEPESESTFRARLWSPRWVGSSRSWVSSSSGTNSSLELLDIRNRPP